MDPLELARIRHREFHPGCNKRVRRLEQMRGPFLEFCCGKGHKMAVTLLEAAALQTEPAHC